MSASTVIVVPTFNGGELVARTVGSIARAGLPAGSYEILVVDNASTDASLDALPEKDEQNAPIRVFRSASNVGRVGNWNRAMEIARQGGFQYLVFLFVGDEFLPGGSLPVLLERMRACQATFGLAPYQVIDEQGITERLARQFDLPSPVMELSTRAFLEKTLGSGTLAFGPLQGNIYRLEVRQPLSFDASDPSHTDQRATIEFLVANPGLIVVTDKPFFAWKAHKGRYHQSMDLLKRLRDDLNLLEHAASSSAVPIDWRAAHATLLVRYLYHARKSPKLMASVTSEIRRRRGGVSLGRVARATVRQLTSRRGLEISLR